MIRLITRIYVSVSDKWVGSGFKDRVLIKQGLDNLLS